MGQGGVIEARGVDRWCWRLHAEGRKTNAYVSLRSSVQLLLPCNQIPLQENPTFREKTRQTLIRIHTSL